MLEKLDMVKKKEKSLGINFADQEFNRTDLLYFLDEIKEFQ